MIKHGEECGDEDDGRQHLKGKIEAQGRALLAQFAEHELRAFKRVTQQPAHGISGSLKYAAADIRLQDEQGKGDLQPETPGDGLETHGATIGRKCIRQAQHGKQTENAGKSCHLAFLPRLGDDAMNQRPLVFRRRAPDFEAL